MQNINMDFHLTFCFKKNYFGPKHNPTLKCLRQEGRGGGGGGRCYVHNLFGGSALDYIKTIATNGKTIDAFIIFFSN